MSFGILTSTTKNEYLKAIGLALSARVSNPGIPLGIICHESIVPFVEKYFDYIIIEDPLIKGFAHKIHLDKYTPFDETFFFDSDVLLFRDLHEVLPHWSDQPYKAVGIYVDGGISQFGQDRNRVLRKIKSDKLVCIDGAGHAYFRKSEASEIFDLARDIASNYEDYTGKVKFADEDIMNIAMTVLQYKPFNNDGFFSRYMSAKPGTLKMDASKGLCEFIANEDNAIQKPYMMHFAAKEAPLVYGFQLIRLYKKYHVRMNGLLKQTLSDYYIRKIQRPVFQLRSRFGLIH